MRDTAKQWGCRAFPTAERRPGRAKPDTHTIPCVQNIIISKIATAFERDSGVRTAWSDAIGIRNKGRYGFHYDTTKSQPVFVSAEIPPHSSHRISNVAPAPRAPSTFAPILPHLLPPVGFNRWEQKRVAETEVSAVQRHTREVGS